MKRGFTLFLSILAISSAIFGQRKATFVFAEPEAAITDAELPIIFATTRLLLDRDSKPLGDETKESRWIDIDLSTQLLDAYADNALVRTFVISTGTRYNPTITGQFRIYTQFITTTMEGPGYQVENVPYAMYFYQGYSIHGAPWNNNFGTPASHGCIQLPEEDAAWLYGWASVGTLVNVHN